MGPWGRRWENFYLNRISNNEYKLKNSRVITRVNFIRHMTNNFFNFYSLFEILFK